MVEFSWVSKGKKLVAALTAMVLAMGLMVVGSSSANATPGQFDAGFNADVGGSVWAIAPAGSGYLIGGQFGTVDGQSRYGVAKITSTGTLDSSFNTPLQINGQVYAIVPDGSGFILGGSFDVSGHAAHSNLVRVNANGSVDSSFGGLNLDGGVESILKTNGKFLIGGSFSNLGHPDRDRLALLTSTGSIDTNFMTPDVNGSVIALAPADDGKFVVGGAFADGTTPNRLMRVTSTGAVDGTFTPPTLSAPVWALAEVSGSGYLVGGDFVNANGGVGKSKLIQITPDGVLKSYTPPGAFAGGNVYSIVPDGDGFFVGGMFLNAGDTGRNSFARLTDSGSIDPSFPPPQLNMNSSVRAILNHNGTVVVGGMWSNTDRSYIARSFNSSLPMAQSQNASNVKAYTATGRGTVTANNAPTLVRCAVSKSSSIANPRYVNASPSSVPANAANRAISCSFTKLEPQTKYYYEVQATNVVGGVASSTRTFTTGAQKPGAVRSLKVGGRVTASKRKVTWAQPTLRGAKSVTYQAQVKRGSRVHKKYAGAKRSWTFNKRGLRAGKYTVQVRAKNVKGYGPWVKKSIRVR
ncbi:MAG: hypothetical protein WAS05_01385 [Candidatus Nanopelagicales bacterium]